MSANFQDKKDKCTQFVAKTLPSMFWFATAGGDHKDRLALVRLVDIFNTLELEGGPQTIDGHQTQIQIDEATAKQAQKLVTLAKAAELADTAATSSESAVSAMEAASLGAKKALFAVSQIEGALAALAALRKSVAEENAAMCEAGWDLKTTQIPQLIGRSTKDFEARDEKPDEYSVAFLDKIRNEDAVSLELVLQKILQGQSHSYQIFAKTDLAKRHFAERDEMTAVSDKANGSSKSSNTSADWDDNSTDGMWEFALQAACAVVGTQLPLVAAHFHHRPAGGIGQRQLPEPISNFSLLFVLRGELDLVFLSVDADEASHEGIYSMGVHTGPALIPSHQWHHTRGVGDAKGDAVGYKYDVDIMVLSFASTNLDTKHRQARGTAETINEINGGGNDDGGDEEAGGGSERDDDGDHGEEQTARSDGDDGDGASGEDEEESDGKKTPKVTTRSRGQFAKQPTTKPKPTAKPKAKPTATAKANDRSRKKAKTNPEAESDSGKTDTEKDTGDESASEEEFSEELQKDPPVRKSTRANIAENASADETWAAIGGKPASAGVNQKRKRDQAGTPDP